MDNQETYKAGDWVFWRTPVNVTMNHHGVNPNTVVRVQLTRDYDDMTQGYETEIDGYGWVTVLASEIVGRGAAQ